MISRDPLRQTDMESYPLKEGKHDIPRSSLAFDDVPQTPQSFGSGQQSNDATGCCVPTGVLIEEQTHRVNLGEQIEVVK